MYKERIKAAIKLFGKIPEENLDMESWRSGAMKETLKKTIECGTVCCVAGWVASSKKFIKEGGSTGAYGGPEFEDEYGSQAIAKYFGFDTVTADQFCGFSSGGGQYADRSIIPLYGVAYNKVKPSDVVRVLKRLLETGK